MNLENLGHALVRGLPDGLIVSDAKGIIRFWNAGAERIFGFTVAEAMGQPLDIIIPRRLQARHQVGYDATMRTGTTKYGAGELLAVPAICKDGRPISIQFSILPLPDDRGGLDCIAAIVRDVTAEFEERKALRRALKDALNTGPVVSVLDGAA